jgi:hypothetical protein
MAMDGDGLETQPNLGRPRRVALTNRNARAGDAVAAAAGLLDLDCREHGRWSAMQVASRRHIVFTERFASMPAVGASFSWAF